MIVWCLYGKLEEKIMNNNAAYSEAFVDDFDGTLFDEIQSSYGHLWSWPMRFGVSSFVLMRNLGFKVPRVLISSGSRGRTRRECVQRLTRCCKVSRSGGVLRDDFRPSSAGDLVLLCDSLLLAPSLGWCLPLTPRILEG